MTSSKICGIDHFTPTIGTTLTCIIIAPQHPLMLHHKIGGLGREGEERERETHTHTHGFERKLNKIGLECNPTFLEPKSHQMINKDLT